MSAGSGTTFNSPEEMQQAYNQMWEDIASGFNMIPDYIKEAFDFASKNPVALIVVSLFLTTLAFLFVRMIISDFSGRSR